MGSRRQKPPSQPLGSPGGQTLADIPEWLAQVRAGVDENTPLMRALIMRSINAVMRFEKLSRASAINATSASTDLGVLIRVLTSGELLEDLRSFEPLAPEFLRGIEGRNLLLNEYGGSLTSEQVAGVLGINRQEVEKRRSSGNLLGLTAGPQEYRYPAWQFTQSGVIPGFEDVLRVLAACDPWMQAAFPLGSNPRWGNQSPLELLKAGQLTEVIEAAEVYVEHGAA